MRILLVEDEPRVADFVKRGLTEEGHEVDVAGDGASALVCARSGGYDVVILDIQLPDTDGFRVTSALRADCGAVPILMLTARDAPEDVIRGLDVGADDYMTKPFDFGELVARVRALGRRAAGTPTSSLHMGDVELDRVRHEVRRGGTPVHVTPTEYRLLESLMSASGEPVGRAELLERVWGMTFDPGTGLIDVHIANLRNKLEHRGQRRVIVAVKGVGFRFDGSAP
ncbi:MAG: response regulator transcription factor [Gemmatimonadetes bacterium]|nr:response regulator transcription factor [Gemmatimonadota bacterium]